MLVDDESNQVSKGAQQRLEKKRKEAEEHKKRMLALKSKKTGATTKQKPGFDRSKLSTAFMSNAKKAKDEVSGWALDFDNPAQNVAGTNPPFASQP